ncbi:tetratricopeptide repeat protein [Polynucleobacter ibericus]|uniref:O-linked N-acetylglucosamine transferase, SPINDLY family protein n=1 Tax=Polynucleobacter ibericus TaxID=1819725 RepID=UPI001BFDBF5A|nr:tetratricopeptide repeat protein [Polynucleobacter ibericus]QWE08770.1 tetratricopeptide repeat protein [Polynucleobacter ibericus]
MNEATNSRDYEQALILLNSGQLMAGIELLVGLLKTNPRHKDSAQLLAQIANSLASKEQSIDLLNRCIEQGVASEILSYELGSHHLALGHFAEALDSLKRVLALNPLSFEALHDLGATYALMGKKKEARDFFLKAAAINDQSADLLYNLGRLYDDQYEHDQAINFYQKAVSADPLHAEAWINLAIDLSAFKKYSEALVCFEKAYALNPKIEFLYGDCIYTRMRMCLWDGMQEAEHRLADGINQSEKIISPLPISALIDSPAINQKAATLFAQCNYPGNPRLGSIPKHTNQKIRIAYFSPDFHEHPVSYLTAEIFELHDRSQFEVYAFSFGKETNDSMRQRLQASFDQFIDIANKTPEEITLLSREMRIDIVIDLCGYTENARSEIFALRAAPIQISYIGFLGTMGADYMDYLIADEVIIPSELRNFYSEKIIYLPSYQANDSKRAPGSKIFKKVDFGIAEDQFVFCNLNNVFKITEFIFDAWLRILKSVDHSALLLFGENPEAISNLKSHALSSGIDPKRLIFMERQPRADYLAHYGIVDLFLDTYPYNAGATASDALWMGTPVLTLQGSSFPSRIASSLLVQLNLPELIHQSIESYEAQAIKLGSQPHRLAEIKKKILANKASSLLFNAKTFVQNLERALVEAQSLSANNHAPKDIKI